MAGEVKFTWGSLEAMAKGRRDIPGISWANISGQPRNMQTITFQIGKDTYRLQMRGGWDVGRVERLQNRRTTVTEWVKA